MPTPSVSASKEWDDLWQALDFAERRFVQWQGEGALGQQTLERLRKRFAESRKTCDQTRHEGRPLPADTGLPAGKPGESPAACSLRYWIYLERLLDHFSRANLLGLSQAHALQAEIRERRAALERRVSPDELPEALPVEEAELINPIEVSPQSERTSVRGSRNRPDRVEPPRSPQRPLLEILLDPRNIQWLLAFGGALMVVGLVILLWVNDFFKPPTIAIGLGIANAALLLSGWYVIRGSRYQLAGRALTLLACLVMPLNLWYYHTNNLVTLDGHLWLAALAMSVLYLASALVLRDEVFAYVFVAGVTLTGLLLLADLPPSPEKFWEIASPATMLVLMGILAIHVERAFPAQEGPFSRTCFGLAFFWSGHVLLAAGLLLLLGAQVAGNWLYQPVFKPRYEQWHATPSPIVGDLRWLALVLVALGTYSYVYSDLVVRRIGIYVHVAAMTLLWSLVLLVELLHLSIGVDTLIIVFALTALVVNVCQTRLLGDSPYTRAFPVLGVLLPILAVLLGVLVYFRSISPDLKSVWAGDHPSWSYLAGMLFTAVSSRFGAYLYRHSQPRLSVVYFFATAAATMVGAVGLLAVLGLERWQQHAPILMLIPIAYLFAAQLYRGHSAEMPLVWVSHAATAVMLVSSLATALEGFTGVVQDPLNLLLALFFAEAALFYGLAAGLRRQVIAVHLCAALACATVWQLLSFTGVEGEYYTLTFALVGLALLVGYRFAVVERFAGQGLADALFQSANTLLSLSFVAAIFLALSRFAVDQVRWPFIGLCATLTLISLLSLVLVRHALWRRWYVVTTIGQALLTFLGMTVLSELSAWQKLEIFSVCVGLLLLVAGHVGWYREQERQRDLVSISLFLGSLLVGLPLAIATLVDRSRDHFLFLNEVGFLAAGILLLTTGFLFQLKSTTLTGAVLTVVYFLTLVIFLPWNRLNAVAIFIIAGGGVLFSAGLLLSVYRDRLLTLPDRIKRREGMFRVLGWR